MTQIVLWGWLALFPLALATPLCALAQSAQPESEVLTGEQFDVEGRTLAEWYALGGWVMHFIVGCSVVSVALVLERLWSTRRGAVIPRRFLREIHEHWHRREIPSVLEICIKSDNSISRVLRAGLLQFDHGLARVEDAVAAQGAHEQTLLRRNLPVLGALGNIATMLGLLGTVLGMIESFDLIARTGTGDARVVAGGIFTALVTTAAGLMVGIPTVAVHSFLRRRVEGLAIRLEDTSIRMLEDLSQESEKPLAPAGL